MESSAAASRHGAPADTADNQLEKHRRLYAIFSDHCAQRRARWATEHDVPTGDGAVDTFLSISTQSAELGSAIRQQGMDPLLVALGMLPLLPAGAPAVFRRVSWSAIAAEMARTVLPEERVQELDRADLNAHGESAPADVASVERWIRLASRGVSKSLSPTVSEQSFAVWDWCILRHRAVQRVLENNAAQIKTLLHRVYAADVVLLHTPQATQCMLDQWKCLFAHQETAIGYTIRYFMRRDQKVETLMRLLKQRPTALADVVEGKPAGHHFILRNPPPSWRPEEEDPAKAPRQSWVGTPFNVARRNHMILAVLISTEGNGLDLPLSPSGDSEPIWRTLHSPELVLSSIAITQHLRNFLTRERPVEEVAALLQHTIFGAIMLAHPSLLRECLTSHRAALGNNKLSAALAALPWSSTGVCNFADLFSLRPQRAEVLDTLCEFGFVGRFSDRFDDKIANHSDVTKRLCTYSVIVPWFKLFKMRYITDHDKAFLNAFVKQRAVVRAFEGSRYISTVTNAVFRRFMGAIADPIFNHTRPLEKIPGGPTSVTARGVKYRISTYVELLAVTSGSSLSFERWTNWVAKDASRVEEWGFKDWEPLGMLRQYQTETAEHLLLLWAESHTIPTDVLLWGGWRVTTLLKHTAVLKPADYPRCEHIANTFRPMDPASLTPEQASIVAWWDNKTC